MITEQEQMNYEIISALVVILILFLIGYNIYKFLDFGSCYFYKKPLLLYFPFFMKKMDKEQESLIRKYFPIYQHLSRKKQLIFNHRVLKFIEYKEYIARDGFEITDEVKVLTAATAVLLTFGMRYYDLPTVEKIIVFPDVYYSVINQDYHQGEFNPMHKTVVFSWPHFLMGINNESDGINLGFHEFAHALFFAGLSSSDTSSEVFQDGLDELKELLLDEQKLEEIKNKGFLRSYAFTNNMEFFSVCIEELVENPKDFKIKLPELYNIIIKMLNFSFIEKKWSIGM